jgi:hypothetical protein
MQVPLCEPLMSWYCLEVCIVERRDLLSNWEQTYGSLLKRLGDVLPKPSVLWLHPDVIRDHSETITYASVKTSRVMSPRLLC